MGDDAELERDLLLARRLKLGVRLVIYPLLLGALVLALHIRHAEAQGGGPATPLVTWVGMTAQRYQVSATTQGDRLTSVNANILVECEDGRTFRIDPLLRGSQLVLSGRTWTGESRADHGFSTDGGAWWADYGVSVQTDDAGPTIVTQWAKVAWHRPGTHNAVTCRAFGVAAQLVRRA
jgi:hypothetical protein